MRLERVEIEGYRGIDRLAIDLDELTTIIGEHDCGKSSLLRAIALVLDPEGGDDPPVLSRSDFHRPYGEGSERAMRLSISLTFREEADEGDGAATVVLRGERPAEGEPVATVEGADELGALRRAHPALIVGGPRRVIGANPAAADETVRTALRAASRAGGIISADQLLEVRSELVEMAGALADQLTPEPSRHRSVEDLTDTPRHLETDLRDALEPDAGRQRRVSALWLMTAILEAAPADGLAEGADPVLLFDDIEANLHPTWLAALTSVAINLPFQKVVATHSSELLAWMPLRSLRRLVRVDGGIEARWVRRERYSDEDLRRLTFHLRLRRGGAFFARCWVLVEGETEAWLVPEFARICGVEFPVEGIRTIEFAQSGAAPLFELADDLGIRWVLLADGDAAGQRYAAQARDYARRHGGGSRGGSGAVFKLPARDIEHYLFGAGFDGIIGKAAGRSVRGNPTSVIKSALRQTSKPGLALEILAEADRRGSDGVPPVMRKLAETALELARS